MNYDVKIFKCFTGVEGESERLSEGGKGRRDEETNDIYSTGRVCMMLWVKTQENEREKRWNLVGSDDEKINSQRSSARWKIGPKRYRCLSIYSTTLHVGRSVRTQRCGGFDLGRTALEWAGIAAQELFNLASFHPPTHRNPNLACVREL